MEPYPFLIEMNPQVSSSSPKGKTSSDRKNFKVTKKGNRAFYQNPNLVPSDWDLDWDEVYESEVTIMPAKKDSGPVPSSSSGRNPNDGILDLSSRANTSGTHKRTRSKSDPGAQTGKRPNKPTPKPGSGKPKTSSTKPKRGPVVPRPLSRGKAKKGPKVPLIRGAFPLCPVLDAVNEAPIDWDLLESLLEEDEAHYKCWTVNEAGEALAKCIAKEGTSSVCQSKDRERNLDGMLQLMTKHDDLRDNEYFYTAVKLQQVKLFAYICQFEIENLKAPFIINFL